MIFIHLIAAFYSHNMLFEKVSVFIKTIKLIKCY